MKKRFVVIITLLQIILTINLFSEPRGNQQFELRQVKEKVKVSQDIKLGRENTIEFKNGKGKLEIPDQTFYIVDYTLKNNRIRPIEGSERKVTKNFQLTIENIDIEYDKKKVKLFGDIYKLEPHGMVFEKPVLLTLEYECPEGYYEENIYLSYYYEETGEWEEIEKVSQDFEKNTITSRLYHFSTVGFAEEDIRMYDELTPNGFYSGNNTEFVDALSGTLNIRRNDISIKGRNIDLTLPISFNSDRFFHYYMSSYGSWWIPETKANYELARGWNYSLPSFINSFQNFYTENYSDLNMYILTKYSLYNDCYKKLNIVYNGTYFRFYNEEFSEIYPTSTTRQITVTRVVEVPEYGLIFRAHSLTHYTKVLGIWWWDYSNLTDVEVYTSDGKRIIFYMNPSNSYSYGKVAKVYDVTNEGNYLEYTYRVDNGKLESIRDTKGYLLNFTYQSDGIQIAYNGTVLVKYKISGNVLNSIHNYVNSSSKIITTYTYNVTQSEGCHILITQPSGLCTDYAFVNYRSNGDTLYKPRVDNVTKGTQKKGYSYYNQYRVNLLNTAGAVCYFNEALGTSSAWLNITETGFLYSEEGFVGKRAIAVRDATNQVKSLQTFSYIKVFDEQKISEQHFYQGNNIVLPQDFTVLPDSNNPPPVSNHRYGEYFTYDQRGQLKHYQKKIYNPSLVTVFEKSVAYVEPSGITNFNSADFYLKTNIQGNYDNSSVNKYIYGLVECEMSGLSSGETVSRVYYKYNPNGSLAEEKTLRTFYGSSEVLSQIIRLIYTYNDYGLVSQIVNAGPPGGEIGLTKTISYDSNHAYAYVSSIQDSGPGISTFSTTYSHDIFGRVTLKRVSDYAIYEYSYDYLGRMTCFLRNSDERAVIIINDTENKITIYDKNNNYVIKQFDQYDRLISIKSYKANGNLYDQTYNEYHPVFLSQVSKTYKENQNNYRVENFFDDIGRSIEVKVTGNRISRTEYDDNSRFVTVYNYKDGSNYQNFTRTYFDRLGQTIEIRQFLTTNGSDYTSTLYVYDCYGKVIEETNPLSKKMYYQYYSTGELYMTTFGMYSSISESYLYNLQGQLIQLSERNGTTTTTFTYDCLSRMLSKTRSSGSISYTYRDDGQVTSMTYSGQESISYLYDSNDRLQSIEQTYLFLNPVVTYLLSYAYDSLDNINKITIKRDGVTVKELQYDNNLNNVKAYTSELSNIAEINYENGRITSIQYGNPVNSTVSYGYNSFLQPTSISSSQMTNSYVYDWQGNVTSWNGTTYQYDMLNRLTQEKYVVPSKILIENLNVPSGSTLSLQARNSITLGEGTRFVQGSSVNLSINTSAVNYTLDYIYDKLGNRTQMKYTYGSNTYINDYSYQGNKQRLSNDGIYAYTYNGLGGLASKTWLNESWSYTYDSFNNLASVKLNGTVLEAYKYNDAGLRLSKKSSDELTIYIYNVSSCIYEETYPIGSYTITGLTPTYKIHVYLAGMHIGTIENGTYYLFQNDHLGSAQVKLNSSGGVVDDLDYMAFGNRVTGSVSNSRFTDKVEDSASGLLYFNARYYDPAIGRFIAEDPIRDGLNWYVYCENNPLKFVDPTGLEIVNHSLDKVYQQYQIPNGCFIAEICRMGTAINSLNGKEEVFPSDFSDYFESSSGEVFSVKGALRKATGDNTVYAEFYSALKDNLKDVLVGLEKSTDKYLVGGMASIPGIADQHWVTLDDITINSDGGLYETWVGTSRNDIVNNRKYSVYDWANYYQITELMVVKIPEEENE